MDPYSSPYIIPNNSPHNPFPHSLLSTRQFGVGLGAVDIGLRFRIQGLGVRVQGFGFRGC